VVTAPTAPPPSHGVAVLTWTAPSNQVTGYRIYYGTASGSYDQARGQGLLVQDPTFTLSGLNSSTTYFFAVTAVNGDQESDYSNEASKAFP
jgi:hypothetical protein